MKFHKAQKHSQNNNFIFFVKKINVYVNVVKNNLALKVIY